MQESRRGVKKQHNRMKNRINTQDSSLELRTFSSSTTFMVEGRVSCTGVENTNTTSGSYVSRVERLKSEQLDSADDCTSCSFTLNCVQVQGRSGTFGRPQREMTELMELYDVPPLQVGG